MEAITIAETLGKPEPLTLAFSNNYQKLPLTWEGTKAFLVRVETILLERQTFALLDYDTRIREGGFYALPKKGEYLFLLFRHESGALFTTLRSYTAKKRTKYLEHLHDAFTLVRTPPEKKSQ